MTDFKSPEWDRKFRSILADIKQGKCVVLVGPEIVKTGGKPLRQVLRDQLMASNADDIAHYYERDGFFLFRDKIAKEDIEREVVLFYQDRQPGADVDETALLNLLRLRAHLFLSINPDNFLSEIAYKYGIKHRFAYFQHGGVAVQDVGPPSADMPLFYNLFGSLQRDDSLVLDYDDLFRLLSSLLGAPGLPNNLALALQQAKHFLFVGFDFDKWYSQLILRILSGEKAIRKFAVDHTEKNDNTTTFLVKQFGIEFIDDEGAFLAELAQRAAAEGALRDIIAAQTPDAVRLTRYLQNGDVLGALNQLKDNDKAREDATQLLARFHDLKDRESRKVIDHSDYSVEYNRIVDAILETIKIHL